MSSSAPVILSTSLHDNVAGDINTTVIALIRHGFSTDFIADKLKLTRGQVSGRVRLYGLQGVRRDFRYGGTPEAVELLNHSAKYQTKNESKLKKEHESVRLQVMKAYREHQQKIKNPTVPAKKQAKKIKP